MTTKRSFYVRGKGPITFHDNEFISSGNEGDIYGKGNLAYKVYYSNRVAPESKIRELTHLSSPFLASPKDILLDTNNKFIGYSMSLFKTKLFLTRLFSNTFWRTNSIDVDVILKLITRMKDIITFIHNNQCLICDFNEVNFLINEKDFTIPYFTDVSSYQTPHHSCSAICLYMIDHSKLDMSNLKFNELTDWFSFSLLTFTLFIGVHPFLSGTHPKFKEDDYANRMKNSLSILNNEVVKPNRIRAINSIPPGYLQWYIDMFEKDLRLPPPSDKDILNFKIPVNLSIINTQHVAHKADFIIREVIVCHNKIVKYRHLNFLTLLQDDNNNWYSLDGHIIGQYGSIISEIIHSPKSNTNIIVNIDKGFLTFQLINSNSIVICDQISSERIFICGGDMHSVSDGHVSKLDVDEMNNRVIIHIKNTFSIMPLSSYILQNGLVVEDILGSCYFSIFTDGRCIKIRVKEFEVGGMKKIIDGRYEGGICQLLVFDNKIKEYRYFVLKFVDKNLSGYRIRSYGVNINEVNFVNFTVLDNGIVTTKLDDQLILEYNYLHGPNNIEKTSIIDNLSSSFSFPIDDIQLVNDGNNVLFVMNNILYSLSMRK